MVYKEYLLLVVGDKVMVEYGLNLSFVGYNIVYDEDINLLICNVFVVVVF